MRGIMEFLHILGYGLAILSGFAVLGCFMFVVFAMIPFIFATMVCTALLVVILIVAADKVE